jgi:hypothetical protein
MQAPVIQIKRGSINELTGLALAEPGFTTDTSELYIGLDGTLSGNKFFGSSRYWRRESSGSGGGVNLFESQINGTNYIGLRAPVNVPTSLNYIFPSQAIDGYFLKHNGAGNLSWSNEIENLIVSGTIQNQGDVNIAGNLSIGNNFSVYGSSITFDTETFNSGARILNVGIPTNPPSDTIWDSGVVFNYFKSGTRYRSGIFWDDSTGRIGIASNIANISNEVGSSYNSPIVDTTSLTWAPLEIGSLWVNDCAGESEVIACSASERTLENITIDGGFY